MRKKHAVPTTPVLPPAHGPQQKLRRPPLPPERITLKAATVQERLKAERVQEELRSLPAWRLTHDERSIDRVRELPDGQQAAAYMALVAALAGLRGQPVDLRCMGSRVVMITLTGFPRGRRGLTQDAFELARILG